MSEYEHGRWNAERLDSGWRTGEEKKIEDKISPYLVPWVELPDNIKEFDRDAVKNFPIILKKIGFEVYKTS